MLMKQLREFIAQTQNDRLKFEGKADKVFVEHRSFRARGRAADRADRQRQPRERPNEQERRRGPDRGREPSI